MAKKLSLQPKNLTGFKIFLIIFMAQVVLSNRQKKKAMPMAIDTKAFWRKHMSDLSRKNAVPHSDQISEKDQVILQTLGRFLMLLGLLFAFLVGVKILTSGIKYMGSGFAQTLFDVTSNPVLSLLSGMLATALLQSSSTTTSIIVGLVSGGASL